MSDKEKPDPQVIDKKEHLRIVAKMEKENSRLQKLVNEFKFEHRALKSENLNFQKEIGKIKAKHITEINKIKALKIPKFLISFISGTNQRKNDDSLYTDKDIPLERDENGHFIKCPHCGERVHLRGRN